MKGKEQIDSKNLDELRDKEEKDTCLECQTFFFMKSLESGNQGFFCWFNSQLTFRGIKRKVKLNIERKGRGKWNVVSHKREMENFNS